jgi:membrane associated rhomboid family serine protease
MERWLARLERRFGRFAIEGLTWYLVGAQAIVFALSLAKPELIHWLVLDRRLVMQGEVWRLVTYLFIPPHAGLFWIVFALYMLYLVGNSLEAQWGAFKFQVYLLIGMLATTVVAFAFDVPATNTELTMSLYLAFATVFPDFEIMIMFAFPVRVKWLGLLVAAALMGDVLFMHEGFARLIPVVAFGNYLLFFAPTLLERFRRGAFSASRHRDRQRFRDATPTARERRVCSLCGVTDDDPSIEFRVCTCKKCGKPTDFCLTHARKH